MTLLLKELREKCEGTTPGPWRSGGSADVPLVIQTDPITSDVRIIPKTQKDAEFIAAANPETVLKLVNALEDAMEALESISSYEDPPEISASYARTHLENIEKELELDGSTLTSTIPEDTL